MKKRILFTLSKLADGGAQRATLNVLRNLDRSQFELGLYIHNQGGKYQEEVPEDIEVRYGDKPKYSRLRLPVLLIRLLDQAKDYDVIVGACDGRETFLAAIAGVLLRKPVIARVANDWSKSAQYKKKRQLWGIQLTHPLMKRIVCISHGALAGLKPLVRVRPERFTVIYNIIEIDRIRELSNQPIPDWARQIFNKPTIIAVGRLVPQKGFVYLLEAHALLRERGIDYNLLILGQGELRRELEQLCEQRNITETVFMPGFVNNPFSLMKAADLFVLSSIFEGFGNVIVEAMSCGTAVVATDCPSGPAEILDNGKYGLLVPPANASSLADAMQTLLTESTRREHLAELGKERAQAFSPTRIIDQWNQLFVEVASEI